MDGRTFNEMKIDQSTEKILKPLPSYVKRWEMTLKASGITASTRNSYVLAISRLLFSINRNPILVRPDDITEDMVLEFIISLQYKEKNGKMVKMSDGYQVTYWYILNNFFKYLHTSGLIQRNFMEGIKRPKNNDLERINENRVLLKAKDFVKILDAVENDYANTSWIRSRNLAVMLVFMNTGIRKTALRTLMINNIDFNECTLHFIDKGEKRHEYVLNERCMWSIKKWLFERRMGSIGKNNDFLFVSLNGTEMSSEAVDNIVHRYTKIALGKELSPHKLRAGYCSILYSKTHDIEFVRRAVGHSSTSTTQRYIVTKGSEKKKAAEIMGDLL